MAGKQSAAMDRAQFHVEKKGRTPPEAARIAGVALQSIYRTAWYKAHREAQKAVKS